MIQDTDVCKCGIEWRDHRLYSYTAMGETCTVHACPGIPTSPSGDFESCEIRQVTPQAFDIPIRMRLPCEGCGELHVDEGEFATKPHHTHQCGSCGLTWRPAVENTIGVRFLWEQSK